MRTCLLVDDVDEQGGIFGFLGVLIVLDGLPGDGLFQHFRKLSVGSEATVLENVIPARETTATVREVDALQRIVLENVHCGLEQSTLEGPVQVELGAHTVVLGQRVTIEDCPFGNAQMLHCQG